jgi:hypothetical protein
MTVKELIEKLKEFDENTDICINDFRGIPNEIGQIQQATPNLIIIEVE